MNRKYKNPPMSFQCPPEVREILETQAKIQDRSISWIIVNYLKKALQAEKLLKQST